MLGILLYIVVYTLVLQQRYLIRQPPVGEVRVSLQAPQNHEVPVVPTAAKYLPYCLRHNATVNGHENKQCRYWDEDLALYPTTEPKTMFISTRVTNSTQKMFNCTLLENTCKFENIPGASNEFYIAGIENFTILIDHSMYVPYLGIQANSFQLPGRLTNHHGHEMRLGEKDPYNHLGHKGQFDILQLRTFLKAAGIDTLDESSKQNRSRSIRDNGVVVLVFIEYSNTYTYSTSNIRYTYSARVATHTKFKAVQSIYTKHLDTERVLLDRHGVRLVFIQTGSLGVFDFQTLLLTIVSGLGLLAITTVIIDCCALRIFPTTRKKYADYKYLKTPVGQVMSDIEPTIQAISGSEEQYVSIESG